jgi:hypothetical protein
MTNPVSEGCGGILIYTGSSDAEGTLGGLVQAGREIRRHVRMALEAGKLCSNDPVCSHHEYSVHDEAEMAILMLSRRSVARPWVNFEAGAAWLADKKVIPVCYGNLSKTALPHPYSAIQALNLQSEAYYLVKSVNRQLNLGPISGVAAFRGTLAEGGGPMKDGEYERLVNALAEFKDD